MHHSLVQIQKTAAQTVRQVHRQRRKWGEPAASPSKGPNLPRVIPERLSPVPDRIFAGKPRGHGFREDPPTGGPEMGDDFIVMPALWKDVEGILKHHLAKRRAPGTVG